MQLQKLLKGLMSEALATAGVPQGHDPKITYATNPKFGDYQDNSALSIAKSLGMNPRELGQKLVESLGQPAMLSQVEVAGPGFINMHLNSGWIGEQLTQKNRDADQLISTVTVPKTIVVDYSGPNLAKEMHVGHLRSTIIGDCLARVFTTLGHKVIRQNHVGDWGTQFGMLIAHLTDLKAQNEQLATELADLESFYRDAKARFDQDEAFAERARQYVVQLQSGDSTCLSLWQDFIRISLDHCFEVYQRLGVLLTEEDLKPESAYNDDLPKVVQELTDKGLLQVSDGAKCVFLEGFQGKDGTPLPFMVQKSDGGYLYATTDFAAIRYRGQVLKADRVVYVVDVRQSLHFEQLFALAKLANVVSEDCQLEHVAFGTMLGNDGKPFKTRSGGTVKLNDLLDEAVERAAKVIQEKNPDMPADAAQDISQAVGINAVKYWDLSKNRKNNYIFDWDKMLAMDGNTAPYMMYAYARIQSVLRKAEPSTNAVIKITADAERKLGVKLLQFSDVVESVAEDDMPNTLCQYLYELAGMFMQFYEQCPILTAEPEVKESRLALAQLTGKTIAKGFDLLGLKTVTQM